MPHGDPAETDPMALNGVMFETDSCAAQLQMAECFVEEYLRSGFTSERIFKLFQTNQYAGANLAYRTLGEARIRSIIDDHARRRRSRPAAHVVRNITSDDLALRVLES